MFTPQPATQPQPTPPENTASDELSSLDLAGIIEQWSTRLESDVNEFASAALQLQQWDEKIRQNQTNLDKVQETVTNCQQGHQVLETSLSQIASSQSHIEKKIEELEDHIKTSSSQEDESMDGDRAELHQRTITVAGDLARLNSEFSDMINSLNGLKREHSIDKDYESITEILNYHSRILDRLDQESENLQKDMEFVHSRTG
ncbi:hypothetical protein P9112_002332 [Eukaryota sp. TZLM1-RC]